MNQINPFYERNFICPICEMKFSSLAVRSSAVYVEKRESDFHNIYRGLNPLHYLIAVCPKCNYAVSQRSFDKKISPAKLAQLRLAFTILDASNTNFAGERDLSTALESMQLAIRTAQLMKSSYGEMAGLQQAAAWLCREDCNVKLEKSYLEQARKYYQSGYEKSPSAIGNLSDEQVTYLIGEISLRLGQYNEAIKWFNVTISNPNIKLNRSLENQARDQWSLARELSKKHATADAETAPSQGQVCS